MPTTYHVTAEFPAGAAGTVYFERKEWLNDHGAIVPPATDTAVLSGSPPEIDKVLRATSEDGVSPTFQYHVRIELTGQEEIIGRMDLTGNAELADIFQWTTPPLPDTFVTRAEYEVDQEALGNPASAAALAAEVARAEAAEAGLATDLATEVTDRATDVDDEETRALTAEGLLDGRVGDLEAIPVSVVNSDGDPGTTIYIGVTEPTDPPFTLAVGDVWLDTTPA